MKDELEKKNNKDSCKLGESNQSAIRIQSHHRHFNQSENRYGVAVDGFIPTITFQNIRNPIHLCIFNNITKMG